MWSLHVGFLQMVWFIDLPLGQLEMQNCPVHTDCPVDSAMGLINSY